MPANRTVYIITEASRGGADVVAAATAALAASYQVLKGTDPPYALSALRHAQELYRMATQLPLRGGASSSYCAEVTCFEGLQAGGYRWKAFASSSVFDDMSLAAAWLYAATGTRSYAGDAQFFYQQHQPRDPTSFIANYDNSGWAAALMIYQLLDFPPAKQQLVDFFRGWMTGRDTADNPVLRVTPRGLHHLGEEPLPNAATAALLALLFAHNPNTSQGLSSVTKAMECFALQQVTYTLGGQMGRSRSFVVGFGSSFPLQPQHQQASCPGQAAAACDAASALLPATANPYVLTGALVTGPDEMDGYADDRQAPQSRVIVAFNVPLMAAVAGLLQHDVGPPQCQREYGLFQSTLLRSTPS